MTGLNFPSFKIAVKSRKHQGLISRRAKTEKSSQSKHVKQSIDDKFWSKVNKTDTCWLWTKGTNGVGYGVFHVKRKKVYAHRFSYELLVGPIPNGMVLDHLCRVTLCVNPNHLEVVTQKENNLRGISPLANFSRRDSCSRGHEYTQENTYHVSGGGRVCLECRRLYDRNRRPNKSGRKSKYNPK